MHYSGLRHFSVVMKRSSSTIISTENNNDSKNNNIKNEETVYLRTAKFKCTAGFICVGPY